MELFSEIIDYYSDYTGASILMVLFFVSLIYIALKDENRNNRTILLYGTVALMAVIFCPLVYWLYAKFVEKDTYWRMFWMLPMGIGFAYVGTLLVHKHKATGLLLILFVLLLGGRFAYTLREENDFADNPYHINQSTIDVADYLDTLDIDTYLVAVPFEMLVDIRVYNVRIMMPYGREQYIAGWGVHTGFYDLMTAAAMDYEKLAEKCRYNNTKYLVISSSKGAVNNPGDSGFTMIKSIGGYDIYEYMGL